jgi:hypothetical protein
MQFYEDIKNKYSGRNATGLRRELQMFEAQQHAPQPTYGEIVQYMETKIQAIPQIKTPRKIINWVEPQPNAVGAVVAPVNGARPVRQRRPAPPLRVAPGIRMGPDPNVIYAYDMARHADEHQVGGFDGFAAFMNRIGNIGAMWRRNPPQPQAVPVVVPQQHKQRVRVVLQECGCCMEEVDEMKMTVCNYGHFGCNKCINRACSAENALLGKTQIACICVGCDGGFYTNDDKLKIALDSHIYKYYKSNQYDAELEEIQKAVPGIVLVQCFQCKTHADITDVPNETQYRCVECRVSTCVKCGNKYHDKSPCLKPPQTPAKTGIHKFEEEETKKITVTCVCKTKPKIIKDGGCNKITCSMCKRYWCWICKDNITTQSYKHFCNQFNCKRDCGNCHTYDLDQPGVLQ